MARYVVRETLTVVFYVDADSPAEAIEKAKERAPLDADEIDTSPRGANKFEAEEDSND